MTLGNIDFRPWREGILRAEVPGERAFATWNSLRDTARDEGYVLVMAGDPAEFDRADWTFTEPKPGGVEAVTEVDTEAAREEFGVVDVEALVEAELEELIDEPDAVTDDEFEILDRVTFLALPGRNPGEALRHSGLRIGPAEDDEFDFSGVLARWDQRYGAYLMAIGPTWYELTRRAPVADPDLAAAIALEIAALAPEVVRQGAESVQGLAEELMSRRHWLVWWPAPDDAA